VGAPIQLDLVVDLNTMDDTGLPWTFLDEAIHPNRLVPGAYIIVGSGDVRAVAQVIDVDNDIVHVRPLRGSVASNAHLLGERRPDAG
jgi:hypothetical protein